MILLNETHVYRIVGEYVTYLNHGVPIRRLDHVSPSRSPMTPKVIQLLARESLIPCWAACITTTGEQPDLSISSSEFDSRVLGGPLGLLVDRRLLPGVPLNRVQFT
jgi:hypothetical protein